MCSVCSVCGGGGGGEVGWWVHLYWQIVCVCECALDM